MASTHKGSPVPRMAYKALETVFGMIATAFLVFAILSIYLLSLPIRLLANPND